MFYTVTYGLRKIKNLLTMIKTTLFIVAAFALTFAANAQVISFETSEGYTAGDINTQNNWTTTGYGDGTFIENQVITTDAFTTGTQALKLNQETSVAPQTNPIVGAFYTYPTPIPNDQATFSADIYISEQSSTSMSLVFALVDLVELKYRTYINFAYDSYVNVLVQGATPGIIVTADAGFVWSPETWYNVKIQTTGPIVKFFINGTEVYEGVMPSDGPISEVRFIHDNYDGFAYVDNFRTNDEVLSNNDVATNISFRHFFNHQNQTLTMNSSFANMTNVEVFNTLGQNVLSQKLSAETENISLLNLAAGAYIIKVSIGSVVKTLKVVKN